MYLYAVGRMIMSRLFSLRENDSLTRLYIPVLFLFFKEFLHNNLKLSNSTILTERLNIFSFLFLFFSSGGEGIKYFVLLFFWLSYHRLKKKPIPRLSSPNDAVCVSPRLFNVLYPPHLGSFTFFDFTLSD